MLDRPAKKFDLSLLDEATYRELAHWVLMLHLDTNLLLPGDDFEQWAQRCGVDLRRMDEGGAVVKRGGGESFFFITPAQYEDIEHQLVAIHREGGRTA